MDSNKSINTNTRNKSVRKPFTRKLRKYLSKITGVRGFFSGKPINPIYLPEEEENDILSIASNTRKAESVLTRRPSFDAYKQISPKIGMDSYLKKYINKDKIYSKFYRSLDYDDELDVIREYQENSNNFYTHDKRLKEYSERVKVLKDIFNKAPKLPYTIYVYRCFQKDVSLKSIEDEIRLGFLSTSLSHNLASKWCSYNEQNCYENKDSAKNVEICIIIPKGTRVLPLVYKLFNAYNQYEIVLPSDGVLVPINECHPKYNLPIHIFFENKAAANSFKAAMKSSIPELESTKSPQSVSSEKPDNSIHMDKRSWNQWLQDLLEQPNPEPIDYMDASIDAYGGKRKKRTTRKRMSARKYY